MEIKLNFTPQSMINEHGLFGDFETMLIGIKSGKHLIIDVSYQSKTRTYISMQVGHTKVGVNTTYPNCPFKLHEQTEYSYFTYKNVTTNHFVLSKKQNYAALMQHIKNIVEHFFAEFLDKIEVDVWETTALKEIKLKYS